MDFPLTFPFTHYSWRIPIYRVCVVLCCSAYTALHFPDNILPPLYYPFDSYCVVSAMWSCDIFISILVLPAKFQWRLWWWYRFATDFHVGCNLILCALMYVHRVCLSLSFISSVVHVLSFPCYFSFKFQWGSQWTFRFLYFWCRCGLCFGLIVYHELVWRCTKNGDRHYYSRRIFESEDKNCSLS